MSKAAATSPMTTEDAEQLLGTLIRLLNPYAKTMHYPPGNPPNSIAASRAPDPAPDRLPQFQLEVDNRYGSQNGGEYLSWEFKGQPQSVKKAARIQYRHPVMVDGRPIYWITDYLLIGFAGSNGPG